MEMVDLLSPPLSENAFHVVLDKTNMGRGNLSATWMKRLDLSISPLFISPLNDSETYVCSTGKVLDEMVKPLSEIVSREEQMCLTVKDGKRQFCLLARRGCSTHAPSDVEPTLGFKKH